MSLVSTSRRPLSLLRHLRLLSSSASVDPTPPTSAVDPTIRSLARQRRFSDIESLINRQKNFPTADSSGEPHLVGLILSYSAAGMIDQAIRTFEDPGTPLLSAARSATSFNALLAACNRTKRHHRRVPDLFAELSSNHSITPNAISYSILIKSHCLNGNASKNAFPILKEMESKKLEINTVVYTTILDSLYKERRPEEAEKLWKDMCSKGCELDLPAYNVRVMHRAKTGKPESVLELTGEMESKGLKPDTITYNYLISCYCNHGKIKNAMRVYKGLEKKGCIPNAATFKVLLTALCKRGDFDEALKVFTESVKADKVPDLGTVKRMMERLVKGSKVGAAKNMVKWLKKKYPKEFVRDWKALEKIVGLEADGETPKEDVELVSA